MGPIRAVSWRVGEHKRRRHAQALSRAVSQLAPDTRRAVLAAVEAEEIGELSPWFLLLAGIAFLVPVAISAGRSPESRLYPRARRAYTAWGLSLYLLGLALALQVAELWRFTH